MKLFKYILLLVFSVMVLGCFGQTYPQNTQMPVREVHSFKWKPIQEVLDSSKVLQDSDTLGILISRNEFEALSDGNVKNTGTPVNNQIAIFTDETTVEGVTGLTYDGTDFITTALTGGTGTTSDLNLKTTTGVGAAGADMHFLVGNNGATEAMTILNNGNIGINDVTPDSPLEILSTNDPQFTISHFDGTDFATFGVNSSGILSIKTVDAGAFGHISLQPEGNVGIGIIDPDRTLEVFGTSGPQLKLTGVSDVFTDFETISGGDLVITPSGGDVIATTFTGGTGTTSDLTLKTTTGVGAAGADMHFKVGNNGATEAMTIFNDGSVLVANDFRVQKSVVGFPLFSRLYNTDNTNASSHAQFEVLSGGTSGGDPQIRVAITGGQDYTLGIDNEDDAFVIVSGTDTNIDPPAIAIETDQDVGIGTSTPLGRFDVVTVATNDDPNWSIQQARVATTDATVTTLQTIPITANRTYAIKATVVARRTGGASGTADDGAFYDLVAAYTTKSATVTLLNAEFYATYEDVAGYDVSLTVSGANALIQVTGVIDTNITWHVTTTVSFVGT